MESAEEKWVKTLSKEVLKQGEHEVMTLDWGAVGHPPYSQAVANIRVVGALIGHFILQLQVSFD